MHARAFIASSPRRGPARLGTALALIAALGSCGDPPRPVASDSRAAKPGAAPAASTDASAAELLDAMLHEPRADAVLAGLADARPQAWLSRLEAIRIARRDALAGGAARLAAIARATASPLEQAAALEALALGYPSDAATLLPQLAAEYAGAREDGRRLAVAALRGRIADADAAVIELLDRDSEEAIVTLRAEIIAGGPPMAAAIARRAPSDARRDLLWRLLGHAARCASPAVSGAPPVDADEIAADADLIAAAHHPAPMVLIFGESRGAAAVPFLRRCLAAEDAAGRVEAATLLGAAHDTASGPPIAALLTQMGDDPRRAPLLVALGALAYAPAEATLVEAAHDRTTTRDADGEQVMPVAQAALAALGSFHGAASHDVLLVALGRTDRPRSAVVAARSLRARGDQADLDALHRAYQLMVDAGAEIAAAEVRDAYEELLGEAPMARDQRAWLVSYHLPGRDVAILTDYPLLMVAEPFRSIQETRGQLAAAQRTVPMARQEIANAIEMRNKGELAHLHLAGDRRSTVDQVDLVAR